MQVINTLSLPPTVDVGILKKDDGFFFEGDIHVVRSTASVPAGTVGAFRFRDLADVSITGTTDVLRCAVNVHADPYVPPVGP